MWSKDDADIGKKLGSFIEEFVEKYDSKWESEVEGELVDEATESLYKIVADVKDFGWSEKTVRIPDCVRGRDDKWTVRIGVEHAKMEKISLILKKDPTNKEAMGKFQEAQEKCLEYMREKRDADCDRDLKYARSSGKVRLKNFYKWADSNLSKRSFSERIDKQLTEKEKLERLEAHDATFRNDDPNFVCKMSEKSEIEPDRVFCLELWDPDNGKDKLADLIRKSKKVDPFYKIHVEHFVKPIYILLKLIQSASYFPRKMRTSRASFIPGPRTIFSLEALTKFVEGVLTIEFTACLEIDYEENGDPGGFAYRKNRGVASCMGIALTDVEKSPRVDGLGAMMVFCDLKKAFNSICRSTLVEVAQKTCGAGGITRTRFVDRTYTFEGKQRGQCANKGVDAGTPISVWGFDASIKTDKSTTAHNQELLSHPNYSDDRNLTGSGSFISSGRFQMCLSCNVSRDDSVTECEWSKSMEETRNERILCAYCFAKKEGLQFHETGKKGPEAMVFLQKIGQQLTPKPNGAETLKLGRVAIPVVDRQRVLGLNIATYPKTKDRDPKLSKVAEGTLEFRNAAAQKSYECQALKMVNKYGYFLEPKIDSFRSLAYRFQMLKEEQTPKRIWQAVMAYLVGKMRFCAAFYFLRSTERQLDTIRFYYGMGLSSIIGMTAYETLGASCCKNMRVSADSKAMKLLLDLTGMPSMKEIAVTDARVFIRQCMEIKSEWFLPLNERQAEKESERKQKCVEKGETYFPKYCSLQNDSLARQCWELVKNSNANDHKGAKNSKNNSLLTTGFLARINKAVGRKVMTHGVKNRVRDMEKYEVYWEASIEATRQKFGSINSRCAKDTYRLMCANELEVIEENDRQCNFRTPSRPLVVDTRCSIYPPIDDNKFKTDVVQADFNCSKVGPQIYLPEVYRRAALKCVYGCLVCGDFVKSDSGVRCAECHSSSRVVHTWCLRKLKIDPKKFSCCDIKQQLVPSELGSRKVVPKTKSDRISLPARFFCLICGDSIAEWEPEYIGRKAFYHDDVVLCRHSDDVDRPCEYGAHETCVHVHNKWLLGSKKPENLVFDCDSVEFYLDPKTVEHLSRKRLTGRKEKIENLKKNNRIRHSNDKRKRRYTNPNNFCKHCNQEIPREQKHHLMQHCTGLSTTPVLKSHITDLRATARRCLEIACGGKPNLKSPAIRKRKWGELDGESLSELTPKRQRRTTTNRRTNIEYNRGCAARPPDPGGTG